MQKSPDNGRRQCHDKREERCARRFARCASRAAAARQSGADGYLEAAFSRPVTGECLGPRGFPRRTRVVFRDRF